MISGTGSAVRCRKKMSWVISVLSCITLPAVHSVAAEPGPDSKTSPEELYRTKVTIASRPEQATVRIDGIVMGATPWKGVLAPGAHRFVLQRSGYKDAARDVLVVQGQKLVVDLTLEAATSAVTALPESPGREGVFQKVRVPTWIALGVGAASLGTAVGFQIAAQGAEDEARNSTTQLEHQSHYATAETNSDVARVLFGVGAAAMVVGATLFTIDVTRRSPIRVGIGPGHASVEGSF
jgi:hypothetical protein